MIKIDASTITNVVDKTLKPLLFDKEGKFKYLSTKDGYELNYDINKEIENICIKKAVTEIAEYLVYSLSSNEFLSAGIIVINSETGDTVFYYSLIFGQQIFDSVLASKNANYIKESIEDKIRVFKRIEPMLFWSTNYSFEYYGYFEDIHLVSSVYLNLYKHGKLLQNGMRMLYIAFNSVSTHTGFKTEVPNELSEMVQDYNYLAERHFVIRYLSADTDDFTKEICNYYVVTLLAEYKYKFSDEFYKLNVLSLIPQLREEIKNILEHHQIIER